jgi:hypothetical protein
MMAFSATAASVYADNSGTNWVTAFTETDNPTLFPDSLTTPFNIPVSADMNFVGRFMLSDMNTNTGHLRIDHVYSQVSAVPLGPSTMANDGPRLCWRRLHGLSPVAERSGRRGRRLIEAIHKREREQPPLRHTTE